MQALPTITAAFGPRRNSLSAIRSALATTVITPHSWPTGHGADPGRGDQDPGDGAVAICYIGIEFSYGYSHAGTPVGIAVVFPGCSLIPTVHLCSDAAVQFHLIRLAWWGLLATVARDRISLTRPLAVLARLLAGIPASYLMMALGAWLPLQNIGAKSHRSYGMYIYAFPLQQLLGIACPNQTPPVGAFVLLSVALTIPLAWGIWKLFEKPVMRCKRLFKPRKATSL